MMEQWKNEEVEESKGLRVKEWKNACPVHSVGFMDLSYGVKCDAGAISTGE